MTMTESVSAAELAALIAGLTGTPAPPPSTVESIISSSGTSFVEANPARQEATLGPPFAASYKGECSACCAIFDLFDLIRADGAGGYLGPCCGSVDTDRGTVLDPAAATIPAAVWLDARYAGSCSMCGTKFAAGALIRSDDAKGWIASCCANLPAAVVVAPPAGLPASTIGELRQVLMDFEASRPRTMQVSLGPSELGTPCQQQIARKLVGAPRQPVNAPTWAPFQGTAVHASMEKVVAFWNAQLGRERWLAEDRLIVDDGLPGEVDPIEGNGDAFDTDWDTVVDWKHTGKTALDKLRRGKKMGRPPETQVSPEYRVQGHMYGLGHERKGRKVRFVRLVLLARSHDYDESQEWTEEYQPDIALKAIDRYYATHDLINAFGGRDGIGDLIGAVPATPSRDTCKWCPFNRPGQPSTWDGCPGDRPADVIVARATDGLIEPATK